MPVYAFVIFLLFSSALSAEQSFSSGPGRTSLIELYSSQGCSSCPPAERWISSLKSSPLLWTQLVPVVFHVDYWNYLGWSDPYSQAEYSQRQREYKHTGHIRSVYTPGFIVNGREWRGWFRGQQLPRPVEPAAELSATLKDRTLTARYDIDSPAKLYVALLASNISTDIQSGENEGKSVTEDFIVLKLYQQASDNGLWTVNLDMLDKSNKRKLALAIWVTQQGDLRPIQATGGWIR